MYWLVSISVSVLIFIAAAVFFWHVDDGDR